MKDKTFKVTCLDEHGEVILVAEFDKHLDEEGVKNYDMEQKFKKATHGLYVRRGES